MLEVVNMNGPGPGHSSFRRHSRMTDDETLRILLKVNTPHNERSLSPGGFRSRAMSPAPSKFDAMSRVDGVSRATTARTSRRRLRAAPSQQKIEDEEALKTKRFWENWAAEATRNLLSDMYEEDDEKKEFVYSGRCGTEPKFQMTRSGSSESIHTDISLLACSDLMPEKKRMLSRPGKKKKPKKEGPNWEMFAKEKKGMLDRFIQADASRIEGYMKNRSGPIQNVTQRSRATDVMTKHERKMLTRCAYSHGLILANDNKSYSTENIVSVIKTKTNPDDESDMEGKGSDGSRALTSVEDGGNLYGDEYGEVNQYKSSGRTPSPKVVAEGLKDRPESAIAALNPPDENNITISRCTSASSDSLGMLRPAYSRVNINDVSRASSAIAPTTVYRRHSTIHGLPDLDGIVSSKVRRRIHTTLKNLSKATGYGDKTDACTVIEEEQGVYTEADYAKHPRYPQHIKIAPSLSRVIREDIRERMGRPRRHEIRMADIQAYDYDQPKIGRSQRNLLIFNWLNELTETGYTDLDVPEIKDLEGTPPNRIYSEFVPGIVGENEVESEYNYRGSPMTAVSRYGALTNYASSRYGGATNYEPSRFGGTTFYEGSDEESEFTSDDSFYD